LTKLNKQRFKYRRSLGLLGSPGSLLLGLLQLQSDLCLNVLLSLLVGQALLNLLGEVALGVSLLVLLLEVGALSDLLMDLSIELLDASDISGGQGLLPSAELKVVLRLVVLDLVDVTINVSTEDAITVNLGVGLVIILLSSSGEFVGRVGNVKSSIAGTLQNGEDLGTIAGGPQTNVKNALEWASVLNIIIDVEGSTINLLDTLVSGIKADLLEDTPGEEESGGISGGIVGQTSSESELSELLRISSAEDLISLQGSVDDLGDDSGGGDTANKAVLGGVVLVLVLQDQTLASVVVGLAFTTSLELSLIAHEIGLVLDELHERHNCGLIKY
jgi:hypothetical protein